MSGPTHPRLALTGLVDGRLPVWRRVLVQAHLDRCTGCALEVARIRSVRRLLVDAPVPEPDPDLEERLLALGRPPVEPTEPTEPAGTAGRSGSGRAVPPRREPVGVLVAGLVLVAAVGAGAVVTGAVGATGPAGTGAPGAVARASLVDVLPRLWTWPVEPGGALGGRPTDNGDSP